MNLELRITRSPNPSIDHNMTALNVSPQPL